MKYAGILVPAYLMLTTICIAQGTTCSNPVTIPLDGVLRTYTTSSGTGTAVVCTDAATSPVTWFAFTTNAQAECPLLNITAANGQPCEIAMYTACNGGNILQAASSMCFDDGTGLWAPAETFLVQANKTYYLRIKTSATTSINIAGQSYSPPNNMCIGAFSIDSNKRSDNNACHKPGQGVTPEQLCALTLENTAFYQYYVASNGVTVINISNISCDNGAGNNNSGFQIGFFTGSCNSLNPIYCTSGAGSFVQATTPALTAGTKVFVAVDGLAGSNCAYSIQAINAYSVLSVNFKNFSVWQTPNSNRLRWTCFNDASLYYEIERSEDGIHFSTMARIQNNYNTTGKTEYNYEDFDPFRTSFYRVKQMNTTGQVAISQILQVKRKGGFSIAVLGTVASTLHLKINALDVAKLNYTIINATGQLLASGTIHCNAGTTQFHKNVSALPEGRYLITLFNDDYKLAKGFLKTNSGLFNE